MSLIEDNQNPVVSFFTKTHYGTKNPIELALFKALSSMTSLEGLTLSPEIANLISRSKIFESQLEETSIPPVSHHQPPKTDYITKLLQIKNSLRAENVAKKKLILRLTKTYIDHLKSNEAQLLSEIDRLKLEAKLIEDLFGRSSRGFDLLGSRKDSGNAIPILETLQGIINENPDLYRLAKRLGQSTSIDTEVKLGEQIRSLGFSEISGYKLSDSVHHAQASELALLKNETGRKIFLKKVVQKTLHTKEFVTFASDRVEASGNQGPLILCIDTSGSMLGYPELVSKALSLVVAKVCRDMNRPVYLINFSDQVHCLDLSNSEYNFDAVLDFLTFSFHGGTDLRKALDKSLEVLAQPHFKNARVCVVSDFRIPKIFIKRNTEINGILLTSGASMCAVVISSVQPLDDLNIFDKVWHYELDPSGRTIGISASQWKEKHL